MFRNKSDVDRHVAKTLAKVKSEKDRNFRAYSIARLYFDVGDYESCVKYVGMYLSVKDDNSAAHNLLGQSYHKLGMVERALAEYKASLALDPNQNNLILKVCELLSSPDIPMDAGSACYWAEKGAANFPQHPAVFALKANILSAQGAGAPATLALLETETNARPTDPVPHARLLRHLVQTSSIQESFKYAFNTNFTSDNFNNSPLWNTAVAEVLAQSGHNQFGWQYWILRLTVLERLTELSLTEGRGPSDATVALWRFDRALQEASQCVLTLAPTKVLAAEALSHFRGQLCFYAATLLLKKAGQEAGGWREAIRAAAPLFLLALQPAMSNKSPPTPTSSLPPACSERLLFTWYKEGAYRRSQAGHTLKNCFKEKRNVFVEKIAQYCSGTHWRDKLYRKIFTSREHLEKINSSYLLNAAELAEVSLHLPKSEELKPIDKVAALLKPNSLHNQIWLGMNADNLADVSSVGMDELRISVNNLSNCGAETLNRLDVDTFLYCAIYTAKQNIENEHKSGYWDPDRPNVLPSILTPQLCTTAQNKWWTAVWKTGSVVTGDLSDVRLTLTRGIETIRCVGSHGLDPELLIELARVFAKRSDHATDVTMQKFLEARANILYSAGVPLLERIRNNISIRPLEKRLFEYTHAELSFDKLETLIEEGKLYLAVQCMNNKDNDKAVEILETIKSPYASFHLYKIYNKLSEEINPERDDKKGKRTLYLTKAREFLYITLDRLKAMHADSEHPLYVELGDHIENVEQALIKVEPFEISRREKYTCSSDEESFPGNLNPVNRNTSLVLTSYTPRSIRRRRNEVQPSPESLEAQIRQLQNKNSVMTAFVDQAKVLVESNKMLVDEVRDMKKAMSDIKSHNIEETIQDQFKNLKVSVDQVVTTKINQFKDENAADVADLKREITELKKELGKLKNAPIDRQQQQLDESEMLMLEEEAGAYFQRQQPQPPVIPPQHYPLYPPGALYSLYGQYPNVPQLFPGALFQDQQLYSDMLVPRTIPQPVPAVVPALVSATPVLPPVTVAQAAILPPLVSNAPAPVLPPASLSLPEQPPQPIIHNYHIPLPQKTTTFQNITPTKPIAQPSVITPVNQHLTGLQGDATSTPKPFSLFDTSNNGSAVDSKPFSFLNSSTAFDMSQNKSGADKSRTLSERSTESYDPIPDFKPIIELPDEVTVVTGEEDEEEAFVSRAKLYRFVDKEWKERGLGNVKLLRNKTTGKLRILMRRERVHTICANHILTPDIEICPMKDKDKTYFWAANDFADGDLKFEKFCIRFKTVELGNEFYQIFSDGLKEAKLNSSFNNSSGTVSVIVKPSTAKEEEEKKDSEKPVVGGLTFFNKPVIKAIEATVPVITASEPAKANPFAGFSFNKTTSLSSTTSTVTAFSLSKSNNVGKSDFNTNKAAGDVRSVDENVIYETTAKIAIVSANVASFNEKGSAVVKVIKDKDAKLMVIKENDTEVWYDHPITKTTKFEPVLQSNTLSWKNPEGVTFRATFSSSTIHKKFQDIVNDCVATASSEGNEAAMIPTTVSSWGDKFKPPPGSWSCNACYLSNKSTDDYCAACNGPKDPSMPKKEDKTTVISAPAQKFTFGIAPAAEIIIVDKPVVEQKPTAPVSSWGDQFKPPPGSWTCKACYINNKPLDNYCVACESPKDPSMPKKEDKSITTTPLKFTFGIPATNGTANPAPAPVVSAPPATSLIAAAPAFGSSTFNFGMPLNKPAVSTPNKSITFGDVAASPASMFPQKNTFQFTLKPKSPAKDKDASANKTHESDNEYASEDEGDHIVFAPIVPLPSKVEVKTGEEEEEVVYIHKAKLYRFSDGEWKECGVGDIKILEHSNTNKLRVLMRREPINKICLNHVLNNDVKYVSKDDKSWLFMANDFSKGELTPTQFCIRFKTKDIAQEFMNAIEKARSNAPASDGVSSPPKSTETVKPQSEDDVIFVSEVKATDEDKEKARKLMLPENFFNYKHNKPCQGCIGCDSDSDEFEKPKESQVVPDKVFPIDEGKNQTEESKAFIFGQKPSVFAPPTTTPPIGFTPVTVATPFANSNTSGSIFSGTNSFLKETKPAQTLVAEPIFTSALSTPQQTATTQGQSLFSSNLFSVKPGESIFGNSLGNQNTQPSPFSFKPATFNNTGTFLGSNQNSLFKAPVPAAPTPSATATQATLLFSQAAKAQESSPAFTTEGSIFNKAFGNPDPKTVFGQANIQSALGPIIENNQTKSIFGGNSEEFKGFSGLPKPPISNPENGEKEPSLAATPLVLGGGIPADLSFSALAAKTNEVPFAGEDKSKTFTWAGAGTPIFGGAKKPSALNKSNTPSKPGYHNESNEGAGGEGEENYDPHYEPIVPMPDEIKVVTGEEEEVVLYSHRAKLYRFTTEWKERGIGDIKLLHHPANGTYRLLLRQSQVHKTVLNQRLTRDIQMLPLAKSDRALMWAGFNFTDDNPEGVLEKLALRFTTSEISSAFHEKIKNAVEELEKKCANRSVEESNKELLTDVIPTTVQQHNQTSTQLDNTKEPQQQQQRDEEEEETEEDEEEDTEDDEDYQGEDYYAYEHADEYYGDYCEEQENDEDLAVVYESDGEMGGKPVQIVLYAAQHGGYLRVYDNEDLIVNTYIVEGAAMVLDDTWCKWTGNENVDDWKSVVLPNAEVASVLHTSFQDLLPQHGQL